MESERETFHLSRRAFLTGVATGLGTALLAACGGGSPLATTAPAGGAAPTAGSGKATAATTGAAAPAASGGKEVTLRWYMWTATDAEKQVWEGLAADVTKAHPNIKITFETDAFASYWDKLQTQLASQTEADILGMQSLRMPGFAVRKALRPLKPFIDKDADIKYDDFFTPIQNGLSYKGQVYAFSYDLGPILLYYNKDLFDAAGVPVPSATEPLGWDQFREATAKLSKPDAGQYGYVIQPNFGSVIPWLWSAGGDYMNQEETSCTLDTPESLAALDFITGLLKDKSAAPITDLANANFASEAFYSGKIAMTQNGPWNFVNVRKNAKFNWDIAPMPRGKAGSIVTVAGSGFGISNNTKQPEEAWQALKVITSQASLEKTAKAGRGYPGRKSAVPAFKVPDAPPKNVDITEQILNNDKMVRFLKTTTTWQETEVMLTQEFNPVYLLQQSPKDIIAKVKPKFDDLLKKHQDLVKR